MGKYFTILDNLHINHGLKRNLKNLLGISYLIPIVCKKREEAKKIPNSRLYLPGIISIIRKRAETPLEICPHSF